MRGLTVMTVGLGLCACSMNNPAFALFGAEAGDGASETSATSAAASGEPIGTTAGTADASGTTSGAGGDASTGDDPSEPLTSTGEPLTSTSEPADTTGASTESMGQPVCELPAINDAFTPHVFVNGVQFVDCGPSLTLKGALVLGSELEFFPDPNCGDNNPVGAYQLGVGYPAFAAQAPGGCYAATLSFKPGETCEIAQLWIAPTNNIAAPLVFAAFTAPALPSFPIKPQSVQHTLCGCPEGGDPQICCPELQPGELILQPTPGSEPVPQFNNDPVSVGGVTYEFYNLESWMGPECADDAAAGRRVDWIAVRTP